jgi:hypothetical protein
MSLLDFSEWPRRHKAEAVAADRMKKTGQIPQPSYFRIHGGTDRVRPSRKLSAVRF